MKKLLFFFLLCMFTSLLTFSQKTDSIVNELQRQKIFEKVERHDKLVEKLGWLMPGLLTLSGVAIIALIITIVRITYLHNKGIQNKVNETVANENSKQIIKNQIDQYFKEKVEEEEKKRLAEEVYIKNKTIYLIFPPEIDQQPLTEYLKKQHQFTGLKCATTDDLIQPQTGDVILFVNEKGELPFDDIAKFGKPFANRVKFFYYNTNNRRWEGELKMSQFANNKETLVPRLLELLK